MLVYVVYEILEIREWGGDYPACSEFEIYGVYSTEEKANEAITAIKEFTNFHSNDCIQVLDYLAIQLDEPVTIS